MGERRGERAALGGALQRGGGTGGMCRRA